MTFTGPRQHETMLSPRQSKALGALARKGCKVGLKAVGLFFATQTGNTEEVAGLIGSATGLEASDYDGEDFSDLDGMIVGCPTWNTDADEMRSGTTWDDYLETIQGYDFKGKTVAVFGCGDSQSYGDNFCDGIEELHNTFQAAGAKMVGYSDASGYDYSESKSVKDSGIPMSSQTLVVCGNRLPWSEIQGQSQPLESNPGPKPTKPE
jgi:flavodoxin I